MLFQEHRRTLSRLPTEPVGELTRTTAIELYRTAHLDYLQLKSTMPIEELNGIVKNSPFKLKTPADLANAVLKYAIFTGAVASRQKLSVTIVIGNSTYLVQVGDGKQLATPDAVSFSSFEDFLQWYINHVLIQYSPTKSAINEK